MVPSSLLNGSVLSHVLGMKNPALGWALWVLKPRVSFSPSSLPLGPVARGVPQFAG